MKIETKIQLQIFICEKIYSKFNKNFNYSFIIDKTFLPYHFISIKEKLLIHGKSK